MYWVYIWKEVRSKAATSLGKTRWPININYSNLWSAWQNFLAWMAWRLQIAIKGMPLFTEVKVNQVRSKKDPQTIIMHWGVCQLMEPCMRRRAVPLLLYVGTVLCTITCYRVKHYHSTPSLLPFYPSDYAHSANPHLLLRLSPLRLRLRPTLLLPLRLGPPFILPFGGITRNGIP